VSSGQTIHIVIKQIEELKGKLSLSNRINYHVICVLTDGQEYDQEYSKELASFGIFCKALRIPLIKDNLLPDSNIVPYNIDLNS
jgi:hypothetical protein